MGNKEYAEHENQAFLNAMARNEVKNEDNEE
jgi:hypothetical protein